jgi:hypothetical protein
LNIFYARENIVQGLIADELINDMADTRVLKKGINVGNCNLI